MLNQLQPTNQPNSVAEALCNIPTATYDLIWILLSLFPIDASKFAMRLSSTQFTTQRAKSALLRSPRTTEIALMVIKF